MVNFRAPTSWKGPARATVCIRVIIKDQRELTILFLRNIGVTSSSGSVPHVFPGVVREGVFVRELRGFEGELPWGFVRGLLTFYPVRFISRDRLVTVHQVTCVVHCSDGLVLTTGWIVAVLLHVAVGIGRHGDGVGMRRII